MRRTCRAAEGTMAAIPITSCWELLLPFLLAAVCSGAAQTTVSGSTNITWEAERLLEFKQGLSQVERLSGWSASNLAGLCDTWHGVVCSGSGSAATVTGLNLTEFNVSGQLTRPLCDLPNLAEIRLRSNSFNQSFPGFLLQSCTELQVLDFSLNSFYGQLPDNMSTTLSKLQEFNMESNYFVGSIPADIGNLSELRLLRLRGNSLSDRIPPELGRLSMLTILDLAYNLFDSEIPPEMANLSSLQEWDTPGCGLIGEIPAWFGNLSHLWFLNLEANSLSGHIPPSLADLSNLTEIYLDRNNLTGPLPPFSSLQLRLKIIQFQYNSLSGTIPVGFASLSSLQTLLFDFNNLTGPLPDGLASLPALSIFAVSDNFLSGTLSSEWGLHSKLFQFDVSNNNFTGTFPPHICNGSSLAYLSLKNNHINGVISDEYGNCKSVLRFIVNNNELSGSVPSALWTLPNIQVISLQNNHLSGGISFGNADVSGSLQTIFLDSNELDGPIPSELGKFWFNISKLTVSENKLSGPIPSEIGHLTQLEVLDLSQNAISGEIPTSIGGCVALTSLKLSENHLSGPIPPELSKIPDLNYLDLSKNQLNGSIPNAIAKSTYVIFDVADNDLSGIVPVPLANAFDAANFEGNPELCISAASCGLASAKDAEDGKLNIKLVVPIIVLGICAALLCVALIARVLRKRTRVKVEDASGSQNWTVVPFQRLGFDEGEIYERLEESNVIGWGGSGRVYKVSLKEGSQVVAVKKMVAKVGTNHERGSKNEGLYRNRRDESSAFKAEMETLGKIQHKNIVRLMCACASKEANLLVYEYMCNGSLGDVLHESFSNELLCWATRFKIALGAAEGLAYLHHDCVPPILHRDIKSNNILLDSSFQAKLADFGVAKILQGKASMTGVVGSVGYIAPEYAYTLKVDEKSDVYSYGVVLLELLTGRSPTSKELELERIELVKWVGQVVAQSKEDFWKVLDCRLEVTDIDKESMANVLKLALLCTCIFPRQRPTMHEVVEFLRRAMPASILLSHQHEDLLWKREKHISVSIIT